MDECLGDDEVDLQTAAGIRASSAGGNSVHGHIVDLQTIGVMINLSLKSYTNQTGEELYSFVCKWLVYLIYGNIEN